MHSEMRKKCDLFISNRDEMKHGFAWENVYTYPLCAILYTNKNKQLDAQVIKKDKALVKEKCGYFSYFRNIGQLPIATILSLESNSEETLTLALKAYDCLKEYFSSSNYLTFAAINLARLVPEQEFSNIARKAKEIYSGSKEKHYFLTGQEDSGMSVMLAMSRRTTMELVEECERCYVNLKPYFGSLNGVQSLSFVLALSEENVITKCNKILSIYNKLKAKNVKYGTHYELAILAIFTFFDKTEDEIVDAIKEVDDYLKQQKGFGFFGIGPKQRGMYAAMIVASEWGETSDIIEGAAITGVTELMIAQEAAVCASAAATAAAVSASSNTD